MSSGYFVSFFRSTGTEKNCANAAAATNTYSEGCVNCKTCSTTNQANGKKVRNYNGTACSGDMTFEKAANTFSKRKEVCDRAVEKAAETAKSKSHRAMFLGPFALAYTHIPNTWL